MMYIAPQKNVDKETSNEKASNKNPIDGLARICLVTSTNIPNMAVLGRQVPVDNVKLRTTMITSRRALVLLRKYLQQTIQNNIKYNKTGTSLHNFA